MLLYVTYGADVIAPMVHYVGCTDVMGIPYGTDVIVHCVWHRCYYAHLIYCCTDVIVHYLWPRCY